MSRGNRDPYLLLGVQRQASPSDITRAYRRAARATHPDNHPGDPAAAEQFNAVTDAYETLRDPRRRAAYDQAHPAVRSAANRRVAGSDPGPVWLDTPRPDHSARDIRFSPAPRGRGAYLRVGPVEVMPPGRQRSAAPYGTQDEFSHIAAFVSSWFGPAW